MIFVGIDWAEAHHDVCVLDEAGRVLASAGCPTASRAFDGCTNCWASTPMNRQTL